MKKYYKDLVNLYGAPSFEREVRNYMRPYLEEHCEEVIMDNLGSVFGVKNKGYNGPIVMMAGHMDEVGAMVIGIESNGLISMLNLGGVNGDVFLSQHFVVITEDGKEIPGITVSKPPHLTRGQNNNSAQRKFTDLKLDIGCDSKEEVLSLGIEIGNQIGIVNNYTVTTNKDKIISKAWDNRFGCGMALEIAEDLKTSELECELWVGATVQEEVGLRGARTASQMITPDIFIAVDCSPAADKFGGSEVGGTLGNGFLMRIYDPSTVMHRGIKKHIKELANQKGIKFQYYKSMGGTDAAIAQYANKGAIVCTIGMPSRYIHSNTSMISIRDYQEVKNMVFELIKSINNDTLKEIKNNV